jgi:hypothetical protein
VLIKDKIYGEELITEPVLIELINSPTLQRLKGISQQGMPRKYYHTEVFSRFEHSVGVLILLKRLNASLNEQIAGLLHDISHTAFSHVIDWVIGDPSKEDYQDNIFLEFLNNSEIPSILKKYNLKVENISNLESFCLLEQHAPKLCADRVDYSLRELVGLNKNNEIKEILNNITSFDNQIAFKTKESALLFGENYSKLQKEHWGGNESKARYLILSDILKIALNKNYLNLESFKKTDKEVLDILINSNNKEITEGLNKLRNGFKIRELKKDEEGILVVKKFRHVDPDILINNKLVSLTSLSNSYKSLLESERKDSQRLIKIEIF